MELAGFCGIGLAGFCGIRLEGSVYQAAMGNLGDFAVKEKLNAVFGRVFRHTEGELKRT